MSDVSVAFSICIMLMLWNSRDCGWTLSWLDNRKGSYRVFTSKSTNIPSALNWRFFKGWQFSYIYIRSLVAVKEHTENGTPILGFCYLRSSTSWISSSNIWWRLSIYMLFNTKQCNSGMMYNSACSRWELHARCMRNGWVSDSLSLFLSMRRQRISAINFICCNHWSWCQRSPRVLYCIFGTQYYFFLFFFFFFPPPPALLICFWLKLENGVHALACFCA